MRTVLLFLQYLALSIWLGALIFFPVVAQTAFTALPAAIPDHAQATHLAGLVVAGSLTKLHWIGMVCGIIFLVLRVFSSAFFRRTLGGLLPIFCAVVMLLLTAFSQFSILPRMETARASIGGIVDAVPLDNPGRQIFDHLHVLSTRLELLVLLFGLAALLSLVHHSLSGPRQPVVLPVLPPVVS